MWHKAFLGGFVRRTVAQTCSAAPKFFEPRRHSPKKRRQAINLAPPRTVRAWGDGPLKLEDAGLGELNMNAGLSEFMSDGFDRLPAEPGHTRPNLCTDQHGRPRCDPTQRWEVAQSFETIHRQAKTLTKSTETLLCVFSEEIFVTCYFLAKCCWNIKEREKRRCRKVFIWRF